MRKQRTAKYKHERLISPRALRRRGKTKFRSVVTPRGHVLRVAFPPGRRRRGAGEVQAILRRKNPELSRADIAELYRIALKQSKDPVRARRMLEAYLAGTSGLLPVKNAPGTKIYNRIEAIYATKAGMPHKCDPKCKKAGHRYVHNFRSKACIYGLPDGSIVID